ncbi:MAG: hypothetical protein FGM46_04310 [Ferruginibacter sp.]|nr:hypothetical protein [Ferruginibacter sp.]
MTNQKGLTWFLSVQNLNAQLQINSTGNNFSLLGLDSVLGKLNEFCETALPTIPEKLTMNSSFYLEVEFQNYEPFEIVLRYQNKGLGQTDIRTAIKHMIEKVITPALNDW